MPGSTRRNFLIAGSAAGITAAVSSGVAAAAKPATAAPAAVRTPADAQPLVAHIEDPSSGKISLLVGEQHIEVTDPDLVGRISRAAQRKA